MKNWTYFRFIFFSITLALIMGGISLLFFNRFLDDSSAKHRDRFLVLLAESIESKLDSAQSKDISQLENPLTQDIRLPPPQMAHPGSGGPVPSINARGGHFRGGPLIEPKRTIDWRHGPPIQGGGTPPNIPPPTGIGFGHGSLREPRIGGPKLWLVGENGNVVFSNNKFPLPVVWSQLPKPKVAHEIEGKADFFRLFPTTKVIRLKWTSPLYLVNQDDRDPSLLIPLASQGALMFFSTAIAFILSFSFLFIYLRRKSKETRTVLQRLGHGDLKARFEIKTFDELGGLLIDFNRMADQIEHLVLQVRNSEAKRKNLVQELGHDLRTPLTSLTASFDTLEGHLDRISDGERKDIFERIKAEIKYFGELTEKLMVIASLDEPNFKSSTEVIDIGEMLTFEIRHRQASSTLRWMLIRDNPKSLFPVQGDPHLIQRLFKNAFDNAARFAKTGVEIYLSHRENHIEIHVCDDGPGLEENAINNFGHRRAFQSRRVTQGLNFSLGLGSVIMKAIAELHGGNIEITNIQSESKVQGALLKISLPKVSI